MRNGDTIVALSSGALPSGIAVIRLSGPKVRGAFSRLVGQVPEPRRLMLADLAWDGELLDQGLVAFFPAPHSFTGEDCGELQVHGSPAVVRAILRRLAAEDGFRLAEAGEFTRRAFENGKLDLTEIEGLGDLLQAETENQRRLARDRLAGGLSRKVTDWRVALLDLRAEIEARLDFSDEGDVAETLPEGYGQAIADLRRDLLQSADSLTHGRILREGLRVALAGAPNAGKSSLLNALARSDVAIVTDEAGTTRDLREMALDLDGQLVLLVDMAGLRETDSKAEAEGVRRAREAIAHADLVLWLVAPDVPDAPPVPSAAPQWRIATKTDLGTAPGSVDFAVSARSGDGLPLLFAGLKEYVQGLAGPGTTLVSHERDRRMLIDAASALDGAVNRLEQPELAAEGLRQASDALARLLGKMDAETVLDRLFSAFCIGK